MHRAISQALRCRPRAEEIFDPPSHPVMPVQRDIQNNEIADGLEGAHNAGVAKKDLPCILGITCLCH